MTEIAVDVIGSECARGLAPLLAIHVQEMRGGEPPQPDRYYAERLLMQPGFGLVGARVDRVLVGFALFFEVPDFMTGLDCGVLDTLFVRPDMRRRGIGRALIDHLTEEGRRRGWRHLRWLVDAETAASTLHDRVGRPTPWRAWMVDLTRH